MKRSEINALVTSAGACFESHGCKPPPEPRWDSAECIIGEVSTANGDANDNFLVNPDIGRFPHVEEDEPALVKLLRDPS